MTRLNISQEIGTPNAILLRFGIEMFNKIQCVLNADEIVVLDFKGMNAISTAFFHGSIGKLYQLLKEDFDTRIKVENMGKEEWIIKYEDAIESVKFPEIEKVRQQAVNALFED